MRFLWNGDGQPKATMMAPTTASPEDPPTGWTRTDGAIFSVYTPSESWGLSYEVRWARNLERYCVLNEMTALRDPLGVGIVQGGWAWFHTIDEAIDAAERAMRGAQSKEEPFWPRTSEETSEGVGRVSKAPPSIGNSAPRMIPEGNLELWRLDRSDGIRIMETTDVVCTCPTLAAGEAIGALVRFFFFKEEDPRLLDEVGDWRMGGQSPTIWFREDVIAWCGSAEDANAIMALRDHFLAARSQTSDP